MTPTQTLLDMEHRMDAILGAIMSRRRKAIGISLPTLAVRTGLDVRELEDHEQGTMPIPATRLLLLAPFLLTTANEMLREIRAQPLPKKSI